MIYDNNSANLLLGCLLLNTQLLNSDKYILDKIDFEPIDFHLRLYQAILALAKHGAKSCDAIDLYGVAENNPTIVTLFDNHSLKDFCQNIKLLANIDNVDLYYEEVRKHTILREYEKNGFDVTMFKDAVNTYTLKEIIDHYDGLQISIKKSFYKDKNISELKVGDGFEEIKELFMSEPMHGATTFSKYLNTAARGWIKGQLSIYSCPSGCVDADTEFFNGVSWKRISDYTKGDKVLQYTDDGIAELVSPWRYVKDFCDEMYYFKTKYGVDQMLSDDHTMILYSRKYGQKKSFTAEEFCNKPSSTRAEYKVRTSFAYGGNGIDLSNAEIKLMCAVICDGYFRSDTKHCTFHLKKDRKKNELRKIFSEVGIKYSERSYETGYSDFTAYVPRREKEFTDYWYNCTNEQLRTVVDNILFWDGNITTNRKRFSTTIKANADFVQFAFASCGYRAFIKENNRIGQKYITNGKEYIRKSTEYVVSISDNNTVGFGIIKPKTTPTVDGYKYCFEVPSHMLVLRRNGNIFVTGNCGKSTLGIANLVKVCCPEIWNPEEQDFIPNELYQHKAGLLLQYEMNDRYEVTPKFVASISGVPANHILDGRYAQGESERVDRAIEILHNSSIHIVTIPSFTVGLIENYIRDYVLNYNVGFVVFDYISEQASVSSDIAKQNGVATRSDQVLATIASKLKDIAVSMNVAMMTFTQTNANLNTQDILDAGVVSGSRAVQNKADVAGIIAPLRIKEKEVCDMIMEGQNYEIRPNRILHLYKVRFGSEEKDIKIWFNLNLSTGETIDCWVTDKFNSLYNCDKTNLRYK